MSMARHRAQGEKPEEVYIVSRYNSHRVYSTLGAARGARTMENKYGPRDDKAKIFRAIISDWEEIE